MLQLKNRTPLKAAMMLLPDPDGIDTLFTIVKATFAFDAGVRLADEQVAVTMVDQHHGDPAASSVRVPSDVCLGKPGTDVLLLGSAWAPGGRPTWQSEVSLSVGDASRRLRVSGDRVWEAGPAGVAVSWVAPFERVPLVWERAFGGTDATDKGPVADPRNPVGVGFRAPHSVTAVHGQPLPNLEDPAAPISSPKDRPQPAAFGPVAAHWEPRRSYAGTYDLAWQKQRAPYLPKDFDPRFFQLAPSGLALSGYLQGGEMVDVRGATPDGALKFQLPMLDVRVTYRLDRGAQDRPAMLDTLVIEPDAGRFIMVWRAFLPCDKQGLKVREIEPVVAAQERGS